MLAPRDRQTLLAALRPPEGFRVDDVVATTFTLDLTALLVAPLAFSLLDMSAERSARGSGAEPEPDPYALLRAAREHAEHMVVFCEATRIVTPGKYRPLFVHLEKCVAQVCAPHQEGVFHPKLWLLRFVGPEQAVRYRFLCASRNLTFDRSWDTLLVLDGELTERTNAITMNRPLRDFIVELPRLVRPRNSLSKERTRLVARMADEVLRVRFELPEGVDALAFHPLGINGYEKFRRPDRIQRALVVSPFLDRSGLQPWTEDGSDHVLISRVDQLDAQDRETLDNFGSRSVLAEALEGEDDDREASERTDTEAVPAGLHAKLYVADDGWNAHVWTGSANATEAGFSRNVEMLVQMIGKKSLLGVQRFLDRGLSEMIKPYTRSAEAQTNPVERQLELRLLRLRRQLADERWVATVGDRSPAGYPFALRCERAEWTQSEPILVRPTSLPRSRAQPVSSSQPLIEFGPCSLEALTSFFAFSIVLEQDGTKLEAEFVLKAELEGAPQDREEQILASLFKDPSQVMHFLGMLLAEDPAEWLAVETERASRDCARAAGGGSPSALLERLLRALHASPSQLDSVEQFMQELARTEAGKALVNDRLLELWEPIYAARQALEGAPR